MFLAVILDWMPSRYDGLIIYTALTFVVAPQLFLSGLFITAIPGILIGAFTARKISGPLLVPNIIVGGFTAMLIEITIFAMRWWPYSISKDSDSGMFWIALVFQTLLPIWIFAIVTSNAIRIKMEQR